MPRRRGLRRLLLSGNKLTSLPTSLSRNCSRLQFLQVGNNQISSLSMEPRRCVGFEDDGDKDEAALLCWPELETLFLEKVEVDVHTFLSLGVVLTGVVLYVHEDLHVRSARAREKRESAAVGRPPACFPGAPRLPVHRACAPTPVRLCAWCGAQTEPIGLILLVVNMLFAVTTLTPNTPPSSPSSSSSSDDDDDDGEENKGKKKTKWLVKKKNLSRISHINLMRRAQSLGDLLLTTTNKKKNKTHPAEKQRKKKKKNEQISYQTFAIVILSSLLIFSLLVIKQQNKILLY